MTNGQVVELVSEQRYDAMFALRTFFGEESLIVLGEFSNTVYALMALPKDQISDVGIAIIQRFFDEENLDPKNPHSRASAAPFDAILANTITSACHAIHTQRQHEAIQREQNKKALAVGRSGLIK